MASSRYNIVSKDNQLAFVFAKRRSTGPFVATRALRAHRHCNSVLEKLLYVKRYFPELEGATIRVGLTRAASGMAIPGGDELWLNPSHLSYHTIAHELVHLLQGTHGIPSGERSCDLFSLARHWTLNDTVPYYVRVPSEFCDLRGRIHPERSMLICTLARRALDMRKRGMRNYIAYFEKSLDTIGRVPRLPGLGRDHVA